MAHFISTSAPAILNTLEDLFLEELAVLHDAESQLLHALPALAKAAIHPDLKASFESHIEPTRRHAVRIEWIFDEFDQPMRIRDCLSLAGLIAEAHAWIRTDANPVVLDAGLVAKVQRIEHHEIAAYTSVRTYARLLGHQDAEDMLQATLRDEAVANVRLTQLAADLNLEVNRLAPQW